MNFELHPESLKETRELDEISDAAEVLQESYGEMAGDEILFRALVSNRNKDYIKTIFWLDVYRKLFV